MNRSYIILLIILLSGDLIYSSEGDSLNHSRDSSTIHYFNQNEGVFEGQHSYVDSSISKFQYIFPFSFKGGLASPDLNVVNGIQIGNVGFGFGLREFDIFDFKLDSIKYFRTRTPYTDIKLIFSSKKEQYFKLLHTQNITKNWNFSIQLIRTNTEGFYLRQNAVCNNGNFSTNYLSTSNRYSLQIAGISRNFKKDENGGVSNDSTIEANIFADKKLFAVNLSDARTRRGVHEIYLKQSLYFGAKEEIKRGDSVIYKRIVPSYYLSHSVKYSGSWFVYSDKSPLSGFYDNIFIDSTATLDSTHITRMENKVELGTLDNSKIRFLKNANIAIGAEHQLTKVNQNLRDTLFSDIGIIASVTNRLQGQTNFELRGNYLLVGPHQGDYSSLVSFGRILGAELSSLKIEGAIRNASPDYVYTKYSSNNFLWYNNFEKIFQRKLTLTFCMPKYKMQLSGEYSSIFNYTYLDSTFLPAQFGNALSVIRCKLEKNFEFKHWNFDNKILYQIVNNEEVLRLPKFVLVHSLYYSGRWFKKVMDVQLGTDVFYFSSYYADAYMPALGLSYIQNKKEIGNYPFLDLFLNVKIKRVRVFVKVEHFASGLLGSNYYIAPHYLANDRQMRFGLSWKFFD